MSADIGIDPETGAAEPLLTYEEWWAEYDDNVCCPSTALAVMTECGCGGSGRPPTGISYLLERYDDPDN